MTKFLVGIDGGGSKTDFLVCDTELNEIGRLTASRSNPNDVGIEAVEKLIRDNISELLSSCGIDSPDICAAFAGIAGLTSADYSERVKRTLADVLPNAKVDALHDGINVLYGAFPFDDGVSIICGTGSSCFVKRADVIYRIGGYGSFDLIGNGYEIGRAGIAHALKTADGREKEGVLETLLHEKLGRDFVSALDDLLTMTKDELAAFAPLVFKAAASGDGNAERIITDNMRYIASLIKRAGEYFDDSYNVALAGGVLKNSISLSLLTEMIPADANLVTSDRAPVFGAAAKARSLIV